MLKNWRKKETKKEICPTLERVRPMDYAPSHSKVKKRDKIFKIFSP